MLRAVTKLVDQLDQLVVLQVEQPGGLLVRPEVVTALAECLVAHMTVPSIAGDAGGTGGGQRPREHA